MILKSALLLSVALPFWATPSIADPTTAPPSATAPTAPPTETASDISVGDIIVTARRRDERLQDVPVAISALDQKQLATFRIADLSSIAAHVPGLVIADTGTGSGAGVNLRGVGAGVQNPATDQLISFNLDGIQVSQGNIGRLGQHDLGQVEVLKGPQALFFGKNSPGGIISLTSQDPGQTFEAGIRAGYEFANKQKYGEAYISGPLTDTLSARLFGYLSDQKGWFRNIVKPVPGITPGTSVTTGPKVNEQFGRLTLLYTPSSDFSAKLKLSYDRYEDKSGIPAKLQYYDCPSGRPILSAVPSSNDCKINRFYTSADVGAADASLSPLFKNGRPSTLSKQALGSLELKYNLSEQLSLTSVSGYFWYRENNFGNYTYTDISVLSAAINGRVDQFTQELRLTSSFDGPLNFLVGGYYQNNSLESASAIGFNLDVLGAGSSFLLASPDLTVKTNAYSAFAQATFKFADDWELSGGARYSSEKKRLSGTAGGVPAVFGRTSDSWRDFSPEVTLKYQPNGGLNVYATYRRGFTSGGFNIAPTVVPGPTVDPSFDPVKARGGEIGLKASPNRDVHFELALFHYTYKGLQLSAFDPATVSIAVVNAGGATTRGVEASLAYDAQWIPGLSFRGAVNYTKATYDRLVSSCYTGQTIAQGCNLNLAAGAYTNQSLDGQTLNRAPRWTGLIGSSYEREIGSGLKLHLSAEGTYSSSYQTVLENDPRGRQPAYWMLNGNISLSSLDDRWTISLIGNNLTNKLPLYASFGGVLTGGGTGTTGPGVPADLAGTSLAPRTVAIQVQFKF